MSANLKWLTLELIKQQTRIYYTIEDSLLETYGAAAEETTLNLLNRSYDELMETYGEVPAPVVQASLMLVDVSYQYRCPVNPTNTYIIPYTFDILVKPYMRLAGC